MSEEEYNNRIGKINAEISTDRVDADREHYLLLQKIYLKDRYIEDLQQKVEQLEKENISLKEANNYHQEVIKSMKEPENAHHYHLENIKLRAINNQLENIRKEAIEFILDGRYGEDDDLESISLYMPDLLNILNKESNKG